MPFGLQFKNDNNQVLVDSDFHQYHYAGQATYVQTVRIPNLIGGNNTKHSTTAGQYMSSNQIRGDIIKYRINTGSSSSSPPMCFIKPSSTGSSAPYCGIVLTKRYSSTQWEMWVLQTRGNTRPKLYCFLPLNDMTSSQKSVSGSHSVMTFNSSRSKTYDSRLKPLKIVGATSARAPNIARTGSIANGFNPRFQPNQVNSYSYSTSTGESNANDLMFYCPSVAHCCQSTKLNFSGDGFQPSGYNSYFYAWARADIYWTFYRNTFRLRSQTSFQSSYTEYACGHFWKSQEKSNGLLGALVSGLLAFFTFGASLIVAATTVVITAGVTAAFTNTGTARGLYLPYENSGRNQSQVQPVLFTKASFYD